MPRSVLLRLTDIRDAMEGIDGVLAGASFDDFARNWGIQRAVERGLEIISESSRHLPDNVKALAVEIPWRQIAAIGNLLRHEYQRTDIRATWNIVKEHLPALSAATDRMIAWVEREEPGQP